MSLFALRFFHLRVFIFVVACLRFHPLWAATDPVDRDFISFLSGTKAPAFLQDTETWKSRLMIQLQSSAGKPRADKIPALSLSSGLPTEVKNRLLRIDALYRMYRLENPDSNWFRETQIPKAIDEAIVEIKKHESRLPEEVCFPRISTENVDKVFEVAKEKESEKLKADKLLISASRPPDYKPQAAADLAQRLVQTKQYESNPKIISRRESGLAPVKGSINQWAGTKEAPLVLREIVFHHSAGSEQSKINQIQSSHQNDNEWSDIGYHFAIDKDGKIFQGRSLEYRGAHAGTNSGNRDTIGIVFIGNHHPFDSVTNPSGYTNERDGTPTPAAVKAAVSLVRALQNPHSDVYKSTQQIPIIRLDIQSVVGHRHHQSTSCPGAACVPLINSLDQIAKGLVK